MKYFHGFEERMARWDKGLSAWCKKRTRKTFKQKKREFQKRCRRMTKQSKEIGVQAKLQKYYGEIFKNTLGIARKWRIMWKLYWMVNAGWTSAKYYVDMHYQDSVDKERKEWMQRLNYVFTFTYDDKKHTKQGFRRKLRRTLKRLGWPYLGVWKRSKTTKRLYFYATIRINEGGMVGMNVKMKEYRRKIGKRISVIKNTYFSEQFGSTVVNCLNRENRKLWRNVLAEINKKRAKIDARGIDKKTFVGDYEAWLRKKKQRRKT